MKIFEKYSFRKKKVILLIVIVLLGAAAYKRAFSLTLQQLALFDELTIKEYEAQNSVETLKNKSFQLSQINGIIGKENVQNEIVQHSFLSFVKKQKYRLAVNSIDEPHQYQHPDFKINTNKVTIKGDYSAVTSFVYSFEKEFNLGRLVSLHLFKQQNKASKKDELLTTIYFQNFSE